MTEITESGYLPDSPYPGIKPFTYAHRNVFFAREREARALLRLVVIHRGVLLYSESGVGKSSLVNAGLIPRIIAEGFQPERLRVQAEKGREIYVERLTVEATGEAECLPCLFAAEEQQQQLPPSENAVPSDDVGLSEDVAPSEDVTLSVEAFSEIVRRNADAVQPLLIFDQFEEWTTLFEEGHSEYSAGELRQMQQAILEALVALLNDRELPVKVLIVLREDYLAQLTPLFERCPTLVDQYLRLAPLDGEQVLRTIRGPYDDFPGHYQPEISADLARTIREQFEERSEGADIRLTEVQIACESLFESSDPDQKFAEHGNVQGILEEYLAGALKSLPRQQRDPAVELLTRMVTSSGTRKRISRDDLLAQMGLEGYPQEIVDAALDSLEQGAKLVRREPLRTVYYYEIASEFLVSWIQKQAEIRRLQRAEKKAARAGKIEEQERKVYRAIESIKALERANRLMSILLGVLAVVCLAAVAAAVFAFVQKGEADAARDAAAIRKMQAETAAAQAAANEAMAVAAATAAAESLQVAQDSLATQEAVAVAAATGAAESHQFALDALATQEAALVSQLQPTATPFSGTPTPTRPGDPSATATPSPTATVRPTVDTPATETAEALATQVASIRATQTAVAQCPFAPEGEFSQIWKTAEVRSRLGCPLQSRPFQSYFAEQPFENGYMYWSKSPDLFIVTIGNDLGAWHLFLTQTTSEYNPDTSCQAEIPPGLYQPISGFGRLWCENPEIREEIGFATTPEVGVFGNALQEFERGLILRDSRDSVYLLFGDRGDYVRDRISVPIPTFLIPASSP